MPELIAPTTRLHAEWLESRDEWGRGVHQDGAGMRPQDDYDSPAGFARWIASYTYPAEGRRTRYDGVFLVRLVTSEHCSDFREWWNTLEEAL